MICENYNKSVYSFFQFLKMFQQDDTFLYSILFPVNGSTCNYSLFELLMMGECFTRNM
jgi:hypothetical protein